MFKTYLKYHNLTASVTTDWELYHDFVELYLKNFICGTVQDPILTIVSTFPVSARARGMDLHFSPDHMSRVGRDLYVGERCVYRRESNRELTVEFKEEDKIVIHCEDYLRVLSNRGVKAILKSIKERLRPKSLQKVYHLFQGHLRSTFHFPLFWFLETRYGCHLLHATAIRLNRGGIVFSGLAEAGKSTLATYLGFNYPGVDILTDNFLLYDSEFIYGFPEASRLAPQSMYIASTPSVLPDAFMLRGRQHWVPPQLSVLETPPQKAFLLCLGQDFRSEPVSVDFFVDTALGLNDVVKEFHNYGYVGVFSLATRRSVDTYASRARTLKHCFRNVSCSLLTLPNVASLASCHDEIVGILRLETS